MHFFYVKFCARKIKRSLKLLMNKEKKKNGKKSNVMINRKRIFLIHRVTQRMVYVVFYLKNFIVPIMVQEFSFPSPLIIKRNTNYVIYGS